MQARIKNHNQTQRTQTKEISSDDGEKDHIVIMWYLYIIWKYRLRFLKPTKKLNSSFTSLLPS